MPTPTHSGIVTRDGAIPKLQAFLIYEKGHWLNATTRRIEHPIRIPDRLPVGSVEPAVTAGLAAGSTTATEGT